MTKKKYVDKNVQMFFHQTIIKWLWYMQYEVEIYSTDYYSIVLQLTYIPFFYILVCDFHNILRNNLHDLHTWIISLIFLLKYWNFLVNKNLNNILLQFKKFVHPIYFFDILQMLFLFMYVLHVSFYWFEQNKLNWTTKYYGYLK